MTRLDSIIQANKSFVRPNAFPPLPKSPGKQIAIFTCMDTRLVDFLEPAMGLKGIFMLGVEEVFVIGHKDCGMAEIDAESVKRKMASRGISPDIIDIHVPDLKQWLGAFSHPIENVERVVKIIRHNPLIPADIPVHGLLFCPDDGHLDIVVNGYSREGHV